MSKPESLSGRVSALRRLMRQRRVDGVLLTDPLNVRFFSGFTGEDSLLLLGRRWATLLTDGRFAEQARLECPRLKAVVRKGPMAPVIAEAVRARRVRRLGVEGGHMAVGLKARLDRALGPRRCKVLAGEVDALREVKDAGELAAIRKALRVAEAAFEGLLAAGARRFVGRAERDVAAELDHRMRVAGAERSAFETIVAAGAHSALPHHRPGPTVIRRGDMVLIDWGAVVDGYCCDLTRVVFTGRIRPDIARVYEIVLRAQSAGVRAIRAGATCASADEAARKVIAAGGYAEAFNHGLGHGFGLCVHESPRLGAGAAQRLRTGMVVTVEPGIYLPGVGGVRIEDDVLVTAGGRRRLSRLARRADAMSLRRVGGR